VKSPSTGPGGAVPRRTPGEEGAQKSCRPDPRQARPGTRGLAPTGDSSIDAKERAVRLGAHREGGVPSVEVEVEQGKKRGADDSAQVTKVITGTRDSSGREHRGDRGSQRPMVERNQESSRGGAKQARAGRTP